EARNAPTRAAPPFSRRPPRHDVVASSHLEVKSQLVLYLAIRRFPPNARAQAAQNNFDGSHCESPFLSSLQNPGDRLGESFPVRGLDVELFAPRAGEFVVLGEEVVLHITHLRVDPSFILTSIED